MHAVTFDNVDVSGIERAVLWDYKTDSISVINYIKTLRDLEYEIRYCRGRYPEEYRRLKLIKHNMMDDYESKIDRIWNDQKTGTYFRKGEKFEPHQVVNKFEPHAEKNHNLNMWDGITGYTEFISGESTDYFRYMGAGTGTTTPTFADPSLEEEVVRVDILVSGDLNSDGIVLKSTAAFPPAIPDSDITEFASFDKPTGGRMEYRVVIETPLFHKKDITFVQASHSTVFQAVQNEE
ncbi:hypothetical protein [Serratia sp. (in: enterobacteria)]|uniref:hypothetical protein n=1 Tax=Serratia sp. (in: enterobacteria) TaxID=616 RepID=UPI0039896B63